MDVKINSKLLKSRNPLEHGFTLENKTGFVRQILDDGYYLVKFPALKIKGLKRVNGIKKITSIELEWYIHETDLQKII